MESDAAARQRDDAGNRVAARAIEEELRRGRRLLAEAQRLAKIGSWEWDIPANRVYWSDELFRIYGLEPGAVQPSYEEFLARIHPDDREAVDARNRKAFADHLPFEDFKRAVRPDGQTFLMRTQGEVVTDDDGNPVRMLGICEDVTAEKTAEEASARLASIVQSSDDAIVGFAADGIVTSWNPGATQIYGYSPEEIIGFTAEQLIPANRTEEHIRNFERVIGGERIEHYETQRVRKDGRVIDVSLTMSPIAGPDGRSIGVSTIARDITERKRFETQLQRLANHDALTSLFNRRRFEEELAAQVAHARRYGTRGCLLILDLDNFKYVNDVFGHGAGDQLLREVSGLLRSRLRVTDVIARLGGDEFAVLLPDSDAGRAQTIASDLLEEVRDRTLVVGSGPIRVTASIGAVVYDRHTRSAGELLAAADRTMYQAKDGGRDRAVVRSESASQSTRDGRASWEHRIRQALDDDLFVLHCQPILALDRNEIAQWELLLRMRGPDGDTPPGAFLGVAERLGLIHAIDRWVVTEAIKLLAELPEITLEVNISARSVDDERLIGLIRSELDNAGVEPTRLIFEVTETAAIANMEQARQLGEALARLGCRFALDDFGTGFGSFYYLKHMPVDYLKIDGDFIRAPRSRADELVVESIVRIAQGLGKQTIAEFVEDADAMRVVREQGVDLAQGYHIGRPAPLDMLALMAREPWTPVRATMPPGATAA